MKASKAIEQVNKKLEQHNTCIRVKPVQISGETHVRIFAKDQFISQEKTLQVSPEFDKMISRIFWDLFQIETNFKIGTKYFLYNSENGKAFLEE